MGNTFEVTIWANDEFLGWGNRQYWQGESIIIAIFKLFKAKKLTGCATLHWRG